MANLEQPSSMAPPTDPTIEPRQVETSANRSRSPSRNSQPNHHSSHGTITTTTATQPQPPQPQQHLQQPLGIRSTDQTPDTTMPPSARHITTAQFNRSTISSSSRSVSTTSSTPDMFKCTPMTVQMTPDYDIVTVPKQLCNILSSEGTLDVSSTEAADSSKSSEYEISDEVLLQFGRHDPSPLQTPKVTTPSRTLFSLENDDEHINNHDNNGDDDEHITHNYSDILLESTSTPYDTPNHSIATSNSSPNSFERAYSDGNVSPIHSPPKHHPAPPRRSLNFHFPPPPMVHQKDSCTYDDDPNVSPTTLRYHSNDNNANNNGNNNTARKQLRSRRSSRTGQRPKSFDRIVNNGKHRGRKKAGGSKNHKNYTDYSLPISEYDNNHNSNNNNNNNNNNPSDDNCGEDYSFDDECFSTESEEDDFMVEDRSERSRDSSSTRLKQHPPHPRLSSSSSSATRRKSSMTAATRQNSCWKNLSHRLTTTQSLIWMLCFVGLTSVTMIVTMNHHMAQVAHMEQQNHLSILFRHPVTKTRGLLLPPPKITQPLIPTEPIKVTSAMKKQQIRGSKPSTETMSKSSKMIQMIAGPKDLSESTSSRRTVNLNTLAQLPHENALQELMLSGHRTGPKGSSSSNDHYSSTGQHHHHHHHHHHNNDIHHHEHHHTTSDHQPHHSHHSPTVSEKHDTPERRDDESKHEEHDHHHHQHHFNSQVNSIRLYIKASPSRIGINAIPKVVIPENWDDDRVQLSFDRIDPLLYGENFETTDSAILPRIVFLDGEYFIPTDRERTVRRHRSEITDSTQLYSILDSGDERIASMELRAPYVQGECVPMKEWQTTFNPSCNGMHELDLASMGDNRMEDDFKLFGMNGFWRNAWRFDSTGGHSSLTERDTVVLKTLRINHRFEDAYFENHRIDAVVLERLTASPHVINVFGFCGHSVLTEFADGKRLGELADKMTKVPLARLQIARDIANGLADVHGIDGDGNATFVHLDINPANVVSIGGTLKLNDFNIGVLRRWNTTSNSPCGIPAKYPNPQWRSPEEARLEQNLTEKVDVFSLGHIFFRLICGHEPWHKLEPGGMPSKEALSEKVRQGILPTIPEEIMTSNDPEIVAVREAMLRCYTYDPIYRPSAREIAIHLQQALNALETDADSTTISNE